MHAYNIYNFLLVIVLICCTYTASSTNKLCTGQCSGQQVLIFVSDRNGVLSGQQPVVVGQAQSKHGFLEVAYLSSMGMWL